jgi:hypothetical protein
MHLANRSLKALACVSAIVLAACGGGSGENGGGTPTSPSGTAGAGSTIVGRINGVTASSAAAAGFTGATAPASSLVVTIAGTNLSTSVDITGRFEMTGVPSGTVQLQFRDAAVNASLQVPNVGSEELIQLQITLSGSSATIVSDERSTGKVSLCHRTESGSYHMIDISVSAEPTHRSHGDAKVGEVVPADPTMVFDPSCRPISAVARAAVEIVKSTNGADANTAPGPSIEVGKPVVWEYAIRNTGTVTLTGIAVADDKGVSVTCPATTLAAGASMTCTGTGTATLGQYQNLGTVTAGSSVGSATDSDPSHYLGVPPSEDTGPKVQLCHRTGNGSYHQIEVSVNAEPAHRAHGDGKIGEPVPGQAGKVFGAGCRVL